MHALNHLAPRVGNRAGLACIADTLQRLLREGPDLEDGTHHDLKPMEAPNIGSLDKKEEIKLHRHGPEASPT